MKCTRNLFTHPRDFKFNSRSRSTHHLLYPAYRKVWRRQVSLWLKLFSESVLVSGSVQEYQVQAMHCIYSIMYINKQRQSAKPIELLQINELDCVRHARLTPIEKLETSNTSPSTPVIFFVDVLENTFPHPRTCQNVYSNQRTQ